MLVTTLQVFYFLENNLFFIYLNILFRNPIVIQVATRFISFHKNLSSNHTIDVNTLLMEDCNYLLSKCTVKWMVRHIEKWDFGTKSLELFSTQTQLNFKILYKQSRLPFLTNSTKPQPLIHIVCFLSHYRYSKDGHPTCAGFAISCSRACQSSDALVKKTSWTWLQSHFCQHRFQPQESVECNKWGGISSEINLNPRWFRPWGWQK